MNHCHEDPMLEETKRSVADFCLSKGFTIRKFDPEDRKWYVGFIGRDGYSDFKKNDGTPIKFGTKRDLENYILLVWLAREDFLNVLGDVDENPLS